MSTDLDDVHDPHLWLEEVQGEQALAWVRAHNAATEQALAAGPAAAAFTTLRARLLEVLDSREQIPHVTRRGPWLYNLWRDAANPRGLWRRTTLGEYRRATPAWEAVIDLDALGRAEGENWVWGGATCLGPDYRRCLVSLSRGGADATVVREFDAVAKRFVDVAQHGFMLPEAKSRVAWLDADTVLVGTDLGAGSLTDSGYPRTVRLWRRGTALADAPVIFEGERADVSAGAAVDHTPGFERVLPYRMLDFYNLRQYVWHGGWQDGHAVEIDKPLDATVQFWRERLFLTLRSDWSVAGRTYRAGSLLVADAAAYLAGERRFEVLFEPTPTRSLAGFDTTRDAVLLSVLDNVAGRIELWRPPTPAMAEAAWTGHAVPAPHPGALSAQALHDPLLTDDPLAEHWLLNAADFLAPDALQLRHGDAAPGEVLKSLPAFFDATGMRVEQRFATSRDGTRVPYFVVWPRGVRIDGAAGADSPTMLYGYGGFEVSMMPSYSGTLGRGWLERGGLYVLANIRGGGEFGPAWHQAALKHQRQRAFDDFIAVAEDLVAAGITRPARLGIQGGSNGGLLVGAVMVQRPELFGAVVCRVPLLDMKRYHRLLAGASWMAEYGDPDDPDDWASMRRWSPFHNVPPASERRLPPVLFTTSTRDDRVHPGHARKMAARLAERGHAVRYWENIEGGHGGAADNAQIATMRALEYAFLWQQIGR